MQSSPLNNIVDNVWEQDEEELTSACGRLSFVHTRETHTTNNVEDAENPWSAGGSGLSFSRDCTIWLDAAAGEFKVLGVPVIVAETPMHVGWSSKKDTGKTVWDGSLILSKFLELQVGSEVVSKRNALELGSGTGLCGASVGVLGARNVWLTDLASCVPNLHETVAANQANVKGNLHVKALDWKQGWNIARHDFGVLFDQIGLILCADVVWLDDLVEPLCSMLQQVLHDQLKNCDDALKSCACCGDGNGMVISRTDNAPGVADARPHQQTEDASDMLGFAGAPCSKINKHKKRGREDVMFDSEATWLNTKGRGAVAYLCYTFRFDSVHALLMRNIEKRFCSSLVDIRSVPFAQHSFDESPPVQVYRIQARCNTL